jgi:negative regulator of sigma E activity
MEANDVKDPEILFESISALVDDELSISEKQELIAKIKLDSTLLEKWRHFYIIKTVMQQHAKNGLSTDEFVRKVMVHAEKHEKSPLKNQQNPE